MWTRNTEEPLGPLTWSKISQFFSEEITKQNRRDIKRLFKARILAACPDLSGKQEPVLMTSSCTNVKFHLFCVL